MQDGSSEPESERNHIDSDIKHELESSGICPGQVNRNDNVSNFFFTDRQDVDGKQRRPALLSMWNDHDGQARSKGPIGNQIGE